MRTTLNLDDDLVKEVKAHAGQEGRTFTSVVEEALRSMIRQPQVKASGRIVLPSWSSGGLLSGVNLGWPARNVVERGTPPPGPKRTRPWSSVTNQTGAS